MASKSFASRDLIDNASSETKRRDAKTVVPLLVLSLSYLISSFAMAATANVMRSDFDGPDARQLYASLDNRQVRHGIVYDANRYATVDRRVRIECHQLMRANDVCSVLIDPTAVGPTQVFVGANTVVAKLDGFNAAELGKRIPVDGFKTSDGKVAIRCSELSSSNPSCEVTVGL